MQKVYYNIANHYLYKLYIIAMVKIGKVPYFSKILLRDKELTFTNEDTIFLIRYSVSFTQTYTHMHACMHICTHTHTHTHTLTMHTT